MSEPTPRPGELCDTGHSIIVAGSPHSDDLAEFFHNGEHTVTLPRKEALANARLFLAAPKLLSELKRLVFVVEESAAQFRFYEQLHLAKPDFEKARTNDAFARSCEVNAAFARAAIAEAEKT